MASEATEAAGLLLVESGRVQLKASAVGQTESFDGARGDGRVLAGLLVRAAGLGEGLIAALQADRAP